MRKSTLGVYQFIHNGEEYDYPFLESLESVLPIADKIVVCECESTDNTLNILKEFQENHKEKVTIIHRPWVKHFTELSTLGNYASTFLDTDWKWQLQSDEVLHQNQYNNINAWLELIEKHNLTTTALTTKYTHFLANFETEFDFCYQEIVRIFKRGSKWVLVGDACQLDGGNPKEVLSTDIMVYHYGKVHEGAVGFKKEINFQNLFKDIGFPDPKMKEMQEKFGKDYCDYVYLFESSIKEGKVRKFEGTHPEVMKKRISQFKDGGWEQFISRMEEGLKI